MSLRLRCVAPGRRRGKVGLVAPPRTGGQRSKRVAIGSATYSVAAGRTGRLTLRLTKTGRRLLARGRGRLAVVMTITPSGTGARAVTRKFMLRAP